MDDNLINLYVKKYRQTVKGNCGHTASFSIEVATKYTFKNILPYAYCLTFQKRNCIILNIILFAAA